MVMTSLADRRRDSLLRDIIGRCQPKLEERGFRLDSRGSTGDLSWVRFGCQSHDGHGANGMLLLLVAHDRREQALVVESRFAEHALEIHTPRRKRIQRYAHLADRDALCREMVQALCSWPSSP
jgi:hypothetical protein